MVGRSQVNAGALRPDRGRGPLGRAGARGGRDGRRQGAGSSRHPCPERPGRRAVRGAERGRRSRRACWSRSSSATPRGAFTGARGRPRGAARRAPTGGSLLLDEVESSARAGPGAAPASDRGRPRAAAWAGDVAAHAWTYACCATIQGGPRPVGARRPHARGLLPPGGGAHGARAAAARAAGRPPAAARPPAARVRGARRRRAPRACRSPPWARCSATPGLAMCASSGTRSSACWSPGATGRPGPSARTSRFGPAGRLLSLPATPGRLKRRDGAHRADGDRGGSPGAPGRGHRDRTWRLGISRRALYERMRKYGLDRTDFKG
ncbi:MAG: hypothetical protein MZU79_02350 [Anaerotruncus sp.]|nr:hypothetical protein [Anaerotruncus sp.]